MGTDAQNPTPTTPPAASPTTPAPDFSAIPGHEKVGFNAIPGHKIEDSSTLHAPVPNPNNPATAPIHAHGVDPVTGEASDFGNIEPVRRLNELTEPIENYTPAGRAEHPILSRVGDATRTAKELLEGGQAAGKPLGTSGSPVANEVNLLSGADDAAALGAKAEDLAVEYSPKIATHLAETGRAFLTSLMDEGRSALEATHDVENPAEAGFASIPGHQKIADAPVHLNASGESAASQEAINRAASEKAHNVRYSLIDGRSLAEQPLASGVDRADIHPNEHQHLVRHDATGSHIVESGAKARPLPPEKNIAPRVPESESIENPHEYELNGDENSAEINQKANDGGYLKK